jgi:hypothetical protein
MLPTGHLGNAAQAEDVERRISVAPVENEKRTESY